MSWHDIKPSTQNVVTQYRINILGRETYWSLNKHCKNCQNSASMEENSVSTLQIPHGTLKKNLLYKFYKHSKTFASIINILRATRRRYSTHHSPFAWNVTPQSRAKEHYKNVTYNTLPHWLWYCDEVCASETVWNYSLQEGFEIAHLTCPPDPFKLCIFTDLSVNLSTVTCQRTL